MWRISILIWIGIRLCFPCKKCDEDSQGNFISFHMSQIDGSLRLSSKLARNSMTIPCHLSRFYLTSMLEHDMAFGQVQVMEFPWHLLRKWWDFHRIWSHFRTKPNSRQKTWENPCHSFYRVWRELQILCFLLCEKLSVLKKYKESREYIKCV